MTLAEPESARTNPAITLISVVLPAPLGPSRPKNSPCSTARLTPASARNAPKRFSSPVTSIAFSVRPQFPEGCPAFPEPG